MLPKRDMTRFVKWPKYVKMQRKMRILKQRLKVPPVINQFNNPLEKNLGKFGDQNNLFFFTLDGVTIFSSLFKIATKNC